VFSDHEANVENTIGLTATHLQVWDAFEGEHLFAGHDTEHNAYRGRAHLAEMIALLGSLIVRSTVRSMVTVRTETEVQNSDVSSTGVAAAGDGVAVLSCSEVLYKVLPLSTVVHVMTTGRVICRVLVMYAVRPLLTTVWVKTISPLGTGQLAMMYEVTVFSDIVAQEKSAVAETVTVDGKGQVEPGASNGGTGEADVDMARLNDGFCVPDLGSLPAFQVNPVAVEAPASPVLCGTDVPNVPVAGVEEELCVFDLGPLPTLHASPVMVEEPVSPVVLPLSMLGIWFVGLAAVSVDGSALIET
jgi:hypothetical protein